jgi:hypothetical protein
MYAYDDEKPWCDIVSNSNRFSSSSTLTGNELVVVLSSKKLIDGAIWRNRFSILLMNTAGDIRCALAAHMHNAKLFVKI